VQVEDLRIRSAAGTILDKTALAVGRGERVAVGRGLTNAEIAETQHLAPSSVKTYISRLLTKLGRRDRVGLVILARDADLR